MQTPLSKPPPKVTIFIVKGGKVVINTTIVKKTPSPTPKKP